MTVSRRRLLQALPPLALAARAGAAPVSSFSVEEVSLVAQRDALKRGAVTAVELVQRHLERIDTLDRAGPALRSVIEVNPDALAIARKADAARAAGQPLGPLHGVPVLVKDNLDTADAMKTTAGSLALLDAPPPKQDSFVVQQLRRAGAVLLGKTNLSEWANLRGEHSISGWSARGGLTRNPYVLTRNTSGSSSGSAVAVAASLCAGAIGTETDGSIVSPASCCGITGFKPTVGLVSRAGIIPLSHTQDTAGPMTRSVADAALLMDVLVGEDPRDPATKGQQGRRFGFSAALGKASLRGVRLGVVRNAQGAGWTVQALLDDTWKALRAAGAELVDVELSTDDVAAAELEVLLYELKADLTAYLAGRGGPLQRLDDVIAFNRAHASEELPWFGQQFFELAAAKGPLTDAAYRDALATCGQLRPRVHQLLEAQRLSALVAPTSSPAWLTDFANGDAVTFSFSTAAAVAGCPHASVPMGFAGELPVNLSFVGAAWDDVRVLALAHAFEQVTHARKAPRYFSR